MVSPIWLILSRPPQVPSPRQRSASRAGGERDGKIYRMELVLFILATGLVVSAAEVLPAYAADFSLGVSPTSATIQIGSSLRFTINVTSQGLTGTINVGIRGVSPSFVSAGAPVFGLVIRGRRRRESIEP